MAASRAQGSAVRRGTPQAPSGSPDRDGTRHPVRTAVASRAAPPPASALQQPATAGSLPAGAPAWSAGAVATAATAWWPAPAPGIVAPAEPGPDRRREAAAAWALRRGLSAIALCAVIGGSLAWAAMAVSLQAQSVQAMQGRVTAVLNENQRLAARLAALDSPSRIETLAIDQLGLQRPAAYVPVPVVPVGPVARPLGRAGSAEVLLPSPPGPLPGSPAALVRAARLAVSGLWRRVAG